MRAPLAAADVKFALSGAAAHRSEIEPLERDEFLGPQPALAEHAERGRVTPAQ
jgi:hypothetical protein